MHDIFLSYSRTDSEIMQKVKQSFKDAGFAVWTDEKIEIGASSWQVAIEKAIQESYCLVVILSPDAVTSEWVREEINYAKFQEKPIFPILARGTEKSSLPLGFTTRQLADIRVDTNYDEKIQSLAQTIHNYVIRIHRKNETWEEKRRREIAEIPDNLFKINDKQHSEHSRGLANTGDEKILNTLNSIKAYLPEPFDWCYVPEGRVEFQLNDKLQEDYKKQHVNGF